ncbi:MAG: ABC transporter permease, partial [Actinomycetota bacterium]|nr:ABC transporter permease [Actinomycetota bacterium]
MLRISLKNLLARRVRMVLSAFAVVLGVAFVAGSLVFTDTLDRSFDGIVRRSVGDVVVRPHGAGGDAMTQDSRSVPGELVAMLEKQPGVARADGNVTALGVFVVGADGDVVGAQGAPGVAVNHNDAPAAGGLTGLTVHEGRAPRRHGEVALDAVTAERAGYRIGDQVELVTSGSAPSLSADLVGTVQLGGGGGLAGATVSVFDTRTAQDLFYDGNDVYSDVWVTAEEGVTQRQLRDAVLAVLPPRFDAVTGDSTAEEVAGQFAQAIAFIGTFLLIFAGVSLVVGSFLIVNTFSILVAQRSRELALLRALGASRRQVRGSVLLEALGVGLLGATSGLGVGLLLALALKAAFGSFGLDLGDAGLVFAGRTVLASYAVGLLVTVVAAYLPARRASRISPVAALRDDVAMPESSMRRRAVVGAGLAVVGGTAMAAGLFWLSDRQPEVVGLGILLVLLGVSSTSPVLGRPVVALVGLLYRRLFGTIGRLAEQNAVRNPRRTAATASALMIGLALVTMMAVLGQSAKASVDHTVEQQFVADYVVSNALGVPFSPTVADRIARLPGVRTVARFRWASGEVDGERTFVGAAEPDTFAEGLEVELLAGDLADFRGRSLLVANDTAQEQGWGVGDAVAVELPKGERRYHIAGLFQPSPAVGTSYVMPLAALVAAGVRPADSYVYIVRGPGSEPAAVERAVRSVVAGLPTVSLKDQAAFAAQQREPIDQLLLLIYALLGLAVIIAVLGIVNTLALSVLERTREVGLLRAVGVSRRQLRTMVRLEAVAITVLGAVLGVVLGSGFGVALMAALADQGIEVIVVPAGRLAAFVVLAGVIGVLAAVAPARRAARLDVL